MRINNNLMAMNTQRQLGIANAAGAKSMEKLSSGYRINRAGDDAAGLSISEKMRGQIRGLNMASKNAQDGISMIQTAEGALQETHAILQRMRELAVQSSNDTNVGIDREAIQREIEQLKSEIDRIGNTTEFNTQSLLKGDTGFDVAKSNVPGVQNLSGGSTSKTQASVEFTAKGFAASDTGNLSTTFTIQGKSFVVNINNNANLASGEGTIGDHTLDSTKTTATIEYRTQNSTEDSENAAVADTAVAEKVRDALQAMINADADLAGKYKVTVGSGSDANKVKIEAIAGEAFDGSAGFIGAVNGGAATTEIAKEAVAASAGTTSITNASTTIDFTSISSTDLAGKGWTINGQVVEFYNADQGVYEGEAIGINVGTGKTGADLVAQIASQLNAKVEGVRVEQGTSATDLVITADALGEKGNGIEFADGGAKKEFTASFQIGANQGQTMEIKIGDMRSEALGVKNVDLSTRDGAQSAITTIEEAIKKVSTQRSELGAFQNRLEHTINNLDTSAENLQAAESRIRDVDMAKEMMEQTRQNILQQASTAMLAQANQAPQTVLQLLR
jgi:flagellin